MAQPKDVDPTRSPRAFYGSELRRLREAAALSQERLGEKVFCSGAYIGQLEAAVRRPQSGLSERFDALFGSGELLTRLCALANKSKHADYFAEVADLEALAMAIQEYAPTWLPGLLQTEEYAKALAWGALPWESEELVCEQVRARMDRACILSAPARPLLWFIVHESALRTPVGGPAVMRGQLMHIASLIEARRIVFQVLPQSALGVIGQSLFLMTFQDAPPLAYVEGLHTGHLLDDLPLVAAYQRSYDLARAVALSPTASLDLIKSMAEEYTE